MLKRLKSVTVRAAAASFLVVSAAPALGQSAQAAPESGAWKALAMAIVFLAAIAVGCFMSPRRTHQD